MSAVLQIRTLSSGRQIEVRRSQDVRDDFWLLVRSEWGSDGTKPSRAIVLPVERLLSRLTWLAPACRRDGIGIEWDDAIVGLIRNAREDRHKLHAALNGLHALDAPEVTDRLYASRFRRELRDFQVRDLGHLLALAHGANFSVPGAGKTTVEYAAYEAERAVDRVVRMLVVAPLSAFEAWMTEAEICLDPAPILHRFGGGPIPSTAEVVLINYQRLTINYDVLATWVASAPSLLVLDEAHRMKRGYAGEWGTACLNLSYLAERRDILTGTPAPQSTLDMVPLLDFVWPNQARTILPPDTLVSQPPADAGHRIARAIRPLFVRTTKRELRLTPPTFRVLEVPTEGLHREIYDALLNQYAGLFRLDTRDRASLAKMGDVVMYMLEAATNPALLAAGSSAYDPIEFRHPPLPIPPDSALADLIASYATYETPRKFVELAKILNENAELGRKTLVWSNFVRNLETLERMLTAFKPAMIHGGIPSEISQPLAPRTREDEIRRFRTEDDCVVLLANPAATSEGISLHEVCHDAIYLDRTFNAGQYLQSVDRIHRLGLAVGIATRITFLLGKETVDELVNRRVERKASRLGQMLDDPDIATMALPEDDAYGAPIDLEDEQELVELFTHLRGEEVGA